VAYPGPHLQESTKAKKISELCRIQSFFTFPAGNPGSRVAFDLSIEKSGRAGEETSASRHSTGLTAQSVNQWLPILDQGFTIATET